jgi:hypothetical protein
MSTILTMKGLMGALSLVPFFSRKRKTLARQLERYYEARKAKACEILFGKLLMHSHAEYGTRVKLFLRKIKNLIPKSYAFIVLELKCRSDMKSAMD